TNSDGLHFFYFFYPTEVDQKLRKNYKLFLFRALKSETQAKIILYGYFQVALSLLAILLSSIFLLGLAAFLNTTLRKPILLRRKFNAKGINGPAYRFFFGNAREILKMKAEASAKPMSSLSHNIFPRLQPHLPAWTEKYGKSFVFWMGPEPMLLISEPELVRVVLNETGKDYQKMEVKGYMLKLFGDGLATSRGEKWAKMKKLANHAFQGDSLKSMIPSMIASTEMMLERWNDHLGEEVEVFKEFTFLTAEVISRTAFGSSYLKGKLVFSKLHKLLELAAKNIFKITIPGLSKVYKLKDEIEAEQLEQVIRDSIIEMIRKRGEEEEDSYGSDFLGLLLKAHHEADESKKITVDDVVDECKTFYVAGHETTTSSLTWTLTIIINESLRLYPPVFHVSRWGEDAQLFRPERFAEGVVAKGSSGMFLPFGMGARNCVGMNFAITEEKIALSMILQRYRFRLSDKYVHSPAQVLTSCPKHGLQIVLEKL
ncbi:Cytochrome P450 CYP749A22, partial [Linum perenne]